ncbi:MAG: TonB-dependent receptor [Akkermansiaceae bacterium]|nr:TonB-dependent receptor [Akkermansiaceae bacterium]
MKHAAFLLITVLPAAARELPEITVMAERLPSTSSAAAPLAEWERAAIRESSPRTLDEMLSSEPSFSLYRRQTALFGNPTSAGVSLRNTGATAASRTLVLLDGMPQNDPFGGWVYWARYDAAAVDSVKIIPSAKAAVWGNQSPAGVVQLSSRDAFTEAHTLRLGGGSHGTLGGSTANQFVNEDGTLGVFFNASALRSDGFFGVAESQRGAVDRRLDLDLFSADLKLAWKPRPGLTVEPMISWYEEERGNGTPLTGNTTEAMDLALRVTAEDPVLSWQALGYYQHRSFSSFFSSVDATRTTETPSLDQHDVPATGSGGALTLHWQPGGKWSVTGGADFRHITGETNEDATFMAGRFTRAREAGGEQSFAGIFAAGSYQIDTRTTLDASARLDAWWLRDGRRIEESLLTGATLRNDRQHDRDGIEPSFALAFSHAFNDRVEAFASAGTSFRLPTLNELHRPFRVKNDIVEANAALDPERFISIEGGVEWKPADALTFRASLFHHWIRDAIANVPVTDPAEIAAIFGTIPAGGSGSQRRNVDKARVLGAQVGAEWKASDEVTVRLDGIWTETNFHESSDQPLLEDKPFPQAPDLRLIAGLDWRPIERLTLTAGYEYGASQFDDALVQRRIGDYTSARIGATWKASENLLYHLRVENLLDEEIMTGLASDGTRSIAGPRALWASVEWSF